MGSSKKRVSSPFHPRYAGSWLALGVLRLLGAVPMPALYHAGTFLGDLLRLLVPSRRRIAERNLALCFPDQPKQQVAVMARENIRNTARMLLYTGFVWWAPREKLMNRVRVRNPQVLEQCLKTGRGIVILAPHFLALELGGVFLSLHYGGVSVYQRTRNPVFDRFMLRARQRFGARLFERKSDLKQMIRAIRGGKPCYYLPDQDPGPRRAVFAPFFGIPTATWPVLGRLAKMGGATVLPCATYLLPKGEGFELIFDAPLEAFPTGDALADAKRMNLAIEACVQRSPLQYFWVHKRFKTRPPGAPDPYD